MSETTFIYALKEPDTGEIRYIGQTNNPHRRLITHSTTKEKCHRGNWIRALKKSGQKPILEIVDEAPYEFRDPIEAAYVQFFREQGCNLVNGTPGGDGVGSGADHPNFGKKASVETRRKLSLASSGENNPNFGKVVSVATRKNISLGTRKGMLPLEIKKKLSVANSGENNPNFGKVASVETRKNLNRQGAVISSETRLKISDSLKLYNAKKKGALI